MGGLEVASKGAVSITVFSLGIYLLTGLASSSSGFRFLGITLIVIGVISMLALCISCTEADTRILWSCYLILISTVAGLGIFALLVSNQGGGESIPGRSYKEYHFESYSNWMKHHIIDARDWSKYEKDVVVKNYVCNKMIFDYQFDSLDAFHKRSLNSFESGCCKPPEECNFNYTNPIHWEKSDSKNYTNDDCNRWDNDARALCFNCDSCKAAFLEDVTHHYFLTGIFLALVAATTVLIWVYGIFARCSGYDSSWSYHELA